LLALKKWPQIGSITIFDASTCTDRGFTSLADLPHLRKLNISKFRTTGKTLDTIGNCKHLRSLALANPDNQGALTDASLASLKKFTRLEALDLSGNPKITDKGMVHVAAVERLEVLYLAKTGITDKGLFELKPLEGLRTLGVNGTKVSVDAAEKFPDEMPNLRVVRR
jgi:hypothetical protein